MWCARPDPRGFKVGLQLRNRGADRCTDGDRTRTYERAAPDASFVLTETALSEARGRPAATGSVEHWEVHSELVLVSPEVRRHALEVLAREHSVRAFRYRAVEGERKQPSVTAPFPIALGLYVGRAIVLGLVPGAIAVGGTAAFALALELVRR